MPEDINADVVVVGGGPGGYVAALRAAQLGLRVTLIEKEFIGGTCLNVGCIPSKALLDATHLLSRLRSADTFGIVTGEVDVDWPTMQRYRAKVVKMLTGGVRGLLRKQGVTSLEGLGRFAEPGVIEVEFRTGERAIVRAKFVIIATGSTEAELPGVPFDDKRVISSRTALELGEVPRRMVVVGAGYIGLEIGSVYSRLGTEVVVLEMMGGALPEMDREIGETVTELLQAQGLDLRFGCRVTGVSNGVETVTVHYRQGDEDLELFTDCVLVAIGRRPNTEGLGVAAANLTLDARGFVPVDDGMRTSVDGIFAVGDIVPTPMLAHVAMDEGVVAAECAAGQEAAMEYMAIPAVVYTAPEVASVGLTEDEAVARGLETRVGRFPFRGNGRARVRAEVEGWVKVIADARSDEILGVHCVGAEASHLIHEAVVAMGYHGYSGDLAVTVHAHPTLSEAFKEAALGVHGRALHI